MEISNLNTLKSILKRYKFAYRMFGEDDVEIGGGYNIKYVKRYYFFVPFVIGCTIFLIGFLVDFILFQFCSVPFLLYAVYGIGQIVIRIKDNRNTILIGNGEIRISMNDRVTTLIPEKITDYEIKMQDSDNELHVGQLFIKDTKNTEHLILELIDDELATLKVNLAFIKEFIQRKVNATNTGKVQDL